jgi:hypothetical protein
MPEKLTKCSLSYPFLNIVQINYIFSDNIQYIYIYEEFEDSLSESVNRRRTDNTMAKYNRNRNLMDINNKIFHLNINI